MVSTQHTRTLPTTPDHIWELLTNTPYGLFTTAPYEDNGIFPTAWGGFRAPKGFVPGAPAGHGAYDYVITTVEPGRRLMFRDDNSGAEWGFVIEPAGNYSKVSHVLELPTGPVAWLMYSLIWRPLWEAHLNDIFANLEQAITCRVPDRQQWSTFVQVLRFLLPTQKPQPQVGGPVPVRRLHDNLLEA